MSSNSLLRTQLNTKSTRSGYVETGKPALSDLQEGIPVFRKTNEGIVQYVKLGSVMYKSIFETARSSFRTTSNVSLNRLPDFDSGWIHVDKDNANGSGRSGSLRIGADITKNNFRYDRKANSNSGKQTLPCPIAVSNWVYTRHNNTSGGSNVDIYPLDSWSKSDGARFGWKLQEEAETKDVFLVWQSYDSGGAGASEVFRTDMDADAKSDGTVINSTTGGTAQAWDEVDIRFQLWF